MRRTGLEGRDRHAEPSARRDPECNALRRGRSYVARALHIAAGAALVAFAAAVLASPALAGDDNGAGAVELSSDETRLLRLTNEHRVRADRPPLKVDPTLCDIARAHAREMIELGYFSHYSPRTGSAADRLRAGNVDFRMVGENLAGCTSLDRAFQAWMDSPSHRQNVLRSEFDLVGVAGIQGGPYGNMYVIILVDMKPSQAESDQVIEADRRAPSPEEAESG